MIFGGLEKMTLIDFPGKTACMVYTIGCNFRCPYCHNPELVNETVEKTYSENDVLTFLDTHRKMLDGVVITGGEPTMHKDLLKFIGKVKKKGYVVKLDTNGTNPAMLRKAVNAHLLDYIAMDIKAPLADYERIVAHPVRTDLIHTSISIIMSSGVPYEFRTTVVKSLLTITDIENIGREIMGAEKYVLQKFIPTKILNRQFLNKVSYSDDEMRECQVFLNTCVRTCEIR